MAYNDHTEYPRGIFNKEDLTNTPVDVGTASVGVRVSSIYIFGGAAAEDVVFANSAGTKLFTIPVGATEVVALPQFRFYAPAGLEVDTATAAGDVHVVIFYHTD